MSYKINKMGWLLLVCAGLLFFSCASNHYQAVDELVGDGDYASSAALVEKNRKSIYRDKDAILYYLDRGMLTHYATDYDTSIPLLRDGERAIEAAYTKSITQAIGSYILNDTTVEYGGEDYEDIYINVFNALNYYHQNKLEDALVEIRQMNNKLSFLSTKYGELTTSLQQQALADGTQIPPNPDAVTQFSDSALARYLGMLFYRGIGEADDARIDSEMLKVAFANAPHVYSYPLPSSLAGDEELAIPQGKARLNVIGFSGLSPIKQEQTLRIPLLVSYNYIKIALPEMLSRRSLVSRIQVEVKGGPRFDLELLEDIDAVAKETFKQKQNLIYMKSIIRATMKGVSAATLDVLARESDDASTGLLLGVLSLGTQVFAEASEQADLRISRYFPAKALAGGVNLDPGVYDLKINYYSANGHLIASFNKEQVPVLENKLNLVEVVCLK
ncbi:MAG: hypothetical protein LBC46_01050 [Treponema sp.]|jgi:hypothetical protein|nr:hypothetical protein [Treponema sp.]